MTCTSDVFMGCVPAGSKKRQLVAVTTYLEATSVPPQTKPVPTSSMETIHGYLFF